MKHFKASYTDDGEDQDYVLRHMPGTLSPIRGGLAADDPTQVLLKSLMFITLIIFYRFSVFVCHPYGVLLSLFSHYMIKMSSLRQAQYHKL